MGLPTIALALVSLFSMEIKSGVCDVPLEVLIQMSLSSLTGHTSGESWKRDLACKDQDSRQADRLPRPTCLRQEIVSFI